MDSQKSQSKLTRTHSSLLRSSPTVRSSIHSLSSIAEISDFDNAEDLELVKPLTQHQQDTVVHMEDESKKRIALATRRHGSTRFTPVLTMVSLTVFTIFSISFLFFYYYFRSEDIPTSENLLLSLIFVAVTLFFASKNKNMINQNINVLKHVWEESSLTRRLCTYPSSGKSQTRQVQWFIGDQNTKSRKGESDNNKIIREGVEFYSNGDFYEGEFHKGKCNGSGVYNFFVHGRYEGDWIDGRYDGYGIESWAKGSKYRGQYRGGLRHGFGVYRFYTGDSFSGEWSNGQSHGVGVQTCSDGSSFFGEFKFGVKHGLGVYHFRNGDRYAGEYFGDKIHGFGVYHFANGHCYEGSWHEGRKQGFGMYTFRNGDTKGGEWDSGSLKLPLSSPNDSVLRAVQAARRTAENALFLRRVDEQVNKAVQAANRAATAARVAAVKAVQNRMDGRFCDTLV